MRDTSKITEIIIHCSDTPAGKPFTVQQIDACHRARKFACIGYHYVIYADGSVHRGRPVYEIGAHAVGHNATSIGICYIGGKDASGKVYMDTRTEAQKEAIIKLIKELKGKYPSIKKVMGHRDTSPDLNHNGVIEPFEYIKVCPCFDAIPEYKHLV